MAQLDELFGRPALPYHGAFPKWDEVHHETLPLECSLEPGFINSFVNRRVRYQKDIHHNTRKKDFWKPPALTWHERRGDCEDYALAKRALWLHNGGREEDTLLLIIWDKLSRGWHATLLVHWEGRWLNLDIPKKRAFPVENFRGIYRPHLMMTATHKWWFGRR